MEGYPNRSGAGDFNGVVNGNVPNTIINGWGSNAFVKMPEERMNYTGERIVEPVTAATQKLAFGPIKAKAVKNDGESAAYADAYYDFKILAADGTLVSYNNFADQAALAAREVTGLTVGQKVVYAYDNRYIPQETMPTVSMRMVSRPVQAKTRSIEIVFSKLAAYTAKKEYGFDLKSELIQQAVAELNYEIDGEILTLLKQLGDYNSVATGSNIYPIANFTWVDEELDTLSYALKAEGFMRKIGQLKAKMYEQTARFMPNWMVVSPMMLPILTFLPGYKGNDSQAGHGAYQCGTLDGMKVFVSPMLGQSVGADGKVEDKVCYIGVLGKEMDTAAACYMPYMPVTPSSLLDLPDFTNAQGWFTIYGLEALNTQLVGKIKVVDGDNASMINLLKPDTTI